MNSIPKEILQDFPFKIKTEFIRLELSQLSSFLGDIIQEHVIHPYKYELFNTGYIHVCINLIKKRCESAKDYAYLFKTICNYCSNIGTEFFIDPFSKEWNNDIRIKYCCCKNEECKEKIKKLLDASSLGYL